MQNSSPNAPETADVCGKAREGHLNSSASHEPSFQDEIIASSLEPFAMSRISLNARKAAANRSARSVAAISHRSDAIPGDRIGGYSVGHENLLRFHRCGESVLDRGRQENSKRSPIPGS